MTDKEREKIIHLMGEVLADIQYIGEVSLMDKCWPLMDDAEELVEVLKRALGIEKLEVPDDTGIPEEMKVHNDPKGFDTFCFFEFVTVSRYKLQVKLVNFQS